MWISVKPVSSRWRSASSTSSSALERVRAFLPLRAREGAELALHAADVRLVEVEVLDEVDLVVAAPHPPGEVGKLTQREQVVGLHEDEAVLEIEPLVRLDLLADGLQRCLDDCHQGVVPDSRRRRRGRRHHVSRSTTA